MIDQSIISGVSFLVMISAARNLGPSSFGLFALLFTALTFTTAIQTSLITTPHNVFGVSRKGENYRRYTGTVAVLQVVLALAIGIICVTVAVVVARYHSAFSSMLLAMTFAAVGWQLHEFTRRVLYTESRIAVALLNDGITHISRLCLLGLLIHTIGLTGERVFILQGATWTLGAGLGFWQIRSSLSLPFELRVASEHWQFGRWLAATDIVHNIPRYVTAGIMTSALSVGAYGAFRAFSQIIQGSNVPLQALVNVLRPKLARDAQSGPGMVWRTLWPVMIVGGAGFLLFGLGVILLRVPISEYIFGVEYVQYVEAMFLLALIPFASLMKQLLSNALQAVQVTRPIFIGSLIAVATGSTLGSLCLFVFGLPAAGAVSLLGTAGSLPWLIWSWKRCMTAESTSLDKAASIRDGVRVDQ